MDTQNWNTFTLGELFDIYTGKDLIYSSLTYGEYPVIGHKAENNGITAYTEKLSGYTLYDNATTISLADRGNFFASVQSKPFYIGTRVKALTAKFRSNIHILLFIATLINKESFRFSYGRNSCDRTDNIAIKLPSININGKLFPDLDYIEKLTKQNIIPALPSKSKAVWEGGYKNTPIHSTHLELHSKEWRDFTYDDVFFIIKGKRLTSYDMESGDYAYIGATDSNNGVTAYIGNTEHIHSGNKITVSYNGSIAEAFYQSDDFWATDDVNVLSLKNHQLNKYIAMFLITLIEKEKYRFNYGRKWKKEIMQQSIIKLPIQSNGSPDWEFMENYIKSLPYSANI